MAKYSIDESLCIRCGVSSSTAPELISLADGRARFVRQPESDSEAAAAEAAMLLCPVLAIQKEE